MDFDFVRAWGTFLMCFAPPRVRASIAADVSPCARCPALDNRLKDNRCNCNHFFEWHYEYE